MANHAYAPSQRNTKRKNRTTQSVSAKQGRFASTNRELERAATVHTGPNYNNLTIPHRLAITLAAQLNRHPRDFNISSIEPSLGDFLVTFPTAALRNRVVYIGVFALDHYRKVQLGEWKPNMGKVYDPASHKARMKLLQVYRASDTC